MITLSKRSARRLALKEKELNERILGDSLGFTGGVRARVIKADEEDPNTLKEPGSKGLDNPTGETDADAGLIEPPYDLLIFAQMRENNNSLTPMIDAYKTNIAGFGYKLKYIVDMNSKDVDESIKTQAKEDWVRLENFYKYCNFDKSFTSLLQESVSDREYIGFGALEILQNPKGEPAGFEFLPAHTLKISKPDPIPQVVKLDAIGLDGKSLTISFQKKFRKFRQMVENDQVWFKEFGDPRKMDKTNGRFETAADSATNTEAYVVEPGNEASALLLFSNSVPYTVYGLPRWLGNIIDMQGSRRASELNYRYFQKGRHCPLAILVKNGSLTESSLAVIKGYVNNVQGVEGAFSYLVLEAIGYDDEEEDPNSTKITKTDIELKPLTETLQTDGLFQAYDQANIDKLRQAMRLPPIYTGASKDYTRATADVAKAITEEQVFQPERQKLADRFNRLVNQALGIKYVEMVLNGPDITNKKDLADTIEVYNKVGGITPNMINQAVSNLLGVEIEPIKEAWADLPIAVVLELVKQNQIKIITTEGDSVGGTGSTEPEETPEETPPEETPPEETPPEETPPAETPPTETPPAETQPEETPPES